MKLVDIPIDEDVYRLVNNIAYASVRRAIDSLVERTVFWHTAFLTDLGEHVAIATFGRLDSPFYMKAITVEREP